MVWAIASNSSKKRSDTELRRLRWYLLLSFLGASAALVCLFGAGVYLFFSRSLYRQLDKKLLTLAQSAVLTHADVKAQGSEYLERVNEVPWRDIFNRDRQSLEWFDAQGNLLANKGTITLENQPRIGVRTQELSSSQRVRTYTISVYQDNPDANQPSLEGYIRASQSIEDVEAEQHRLLWGLGLGGVGALAFSTGGSLLLTYRALAPVERNLKQLRQFTADASHELRSPLAAIKASVEVMQNHPERIHPKDAKKLAAIISATDQMNRLVEDLLFLARADTSRFTLTQDWKLVNLNQILEELVELFEPSAHTLGVKLQTEFFGVEVKVFGDASQLNRLFANLLRNALQYTRFEGTVALSLHKHYRYCLVKVKDTGIGISPEQQPFVFERFWRADVSRSGPFRGTGLGLSIAQAIAHRHGGKITLTSQVGVGSCFTVHLPLAYGGLLLEEGKKHKEKSTS